MPGVEFDPALNDSNTCFHGDNINCNINSCCQPVCKSMHFDPGHGFKIHLDKFYELTNNTGTLDPEILSYF